MLDPFDHVIGAVGHQVAAEIPADRHLGQRRADGGRRRFDPGNGVVVWVNPFHGMARQLTREPHSLRCLFVLFVIFSHRYAPSFVAADFAWTVPCTAFAGACK